MLWGIIMNIRQLASLTVFSVLLSHNITSMDIVQHSRVSNSQKKVLSALMIKGGLQAPESIAKHNPLLLCRDGDFHLIAKGKHSKIPFHRVRGLKNKLTPEQFRAYLQNGGYFRVTKNNQNDFCLDAKVRGLGGGPIAASVAYWAVKAGAYGIGAAAAGTAIAATGGAATVAITGAAEIALAGSVTGAAAVGVAVTQVGRATEAAVVTAGVATSVGGLAALTESIECLSLSLPIVLRCFFLGPNDPRKYIERLLI